MTSKEKRKDREMWNTLSYEELWNKLQGMYHPGRLHYFKKCAELNAQTALIMEAECRIKLLADSLLHGNELPKPKYKKVTKPVKMEDPKTYHLCDQLAPKALKNYQKKKSKKNKALREFKDRCTKFERMNKRYLDI